MRWHGGSILLVLLAIAVGSGDAHAQRNPTAAHFDRMAAWLGVGGGARDFQLYRRPTPARVAALWDTLNALVLRELARKPSVAAANARLGKLRGFEPGGLARGKGIGPAIHGGLIPVSPPTYWGARWIRPARSLSPRTSWAPSCPAG